MVEDVDARGLERADENNGADVKALSVERGAVGRAAKEVVAADVVARPAVDSFDVDFSAAVVTAEAALLSSESCRGMMFDTMRSKRKKVNLEMSRLFGLRISVPKTELSA